MKKIVVINGSGGVGKDTFIDLCHGHVKCSRVSSVDLVKEAAEILGWDGNKDNMSRKFLSDLKDLSTSYNNQPYKYIKCVINMFYNEPDTKILFVIIREPSEISKIKNQINDIYTLLITRPNIDKIVSNHADAEVENYLYDYVIENIGTIEDLEKKAEEFIFKLSKSKRKGEQ